MTRLVRIHWRTVGRIIERVCADELDRDRLDDLFEIGIDAAVRSDRTGQPSPSAAGLRRAIPTAALKPARW